MLRADDAVVHKFVLFEQLNGLMDKLRRVLLDFDAPVFSGESTEQLFKRWNFDALSAERK